jgi:hypothetical protein
VVVVVVVVAAAVATMVEAVVESWVFGFDPMYGQDNLFSTQFGLER